MLLGGLGVTGVAYGNLGQVEELVSYPGYYSIVVADTVAPLGVGEVAVELTITGLEFGVYDIFLSRDFYIPDGSIAIMTVTVMPEPMTMGLLAVGGLFLRRRK